MLDAHLLTQIVKAAIGIEPQVLEHLSDETKQALKAAPGYEGIRNTYWAEIYDAVWEYLTSDRPITSFKSRMKQAAVEAFGATADLAYEEGGGELPLDEDTLAWFNGEVAKELGYIDELFTRLRKSDGLDPITEAFARADGYASRLDSLYGESKMRGSKNITLEFGGDDGKESCPDCKRMKGKRHKISYILEHDLIPRPGNSTYQCNGYNCDHFWFNPKTGERFDA